MQFLGTFEEESDVILEMTWVPAREDEVVDSSTVVVRHASSTDVIGPVVADATDTPNKFETVVRLPRKGRWLVEWSSVPAGGQSDSMLYVE